MAVTPKHEGFRCVVYGLVSASPRERWQATPHAARGTAWDWNKRTRKPAPAEAEGDVAAQTQSRAGTLNPDDARMAAERRRRNRTWKRSGLQPQRVHA
jgi:hypothetical protein